MPEDKLAKALKSKKTDHISIWWIEALMNGFGLWTAYEFQKRIVSFWRLYCNIIKQHNVVSKV